MVDIYLDNDFKKDMRIFIRTKKNRIKNKVQKRLSMRVGEVISETDIEQHEIFKFLDHEPIDENAVLRFKARSDT